MRWLLVQRADAAATDDESRTPFQAARGPNAEAVEVLLEAHMPGASVMG